MTKAKASKENISYIFLRYLIILFAGLGNLFIFYKLLTPLTKYAVYYSLKPFIELSLVGNFIIYNSFAFELISACVAGSAFYLLFILIMSSYGIKAKTRLQLIIFSFFTLLILNILRIDLLILASNSVYFEFIHLFFWYFLSTIFVIIIWFLCIKLFKIKSIPVYTDFKLIFKKI